MVINVTYKQVRDGGACREEAYRYLRKIRRRLGSSVPLDGPIDLLTILDVCGLGAALDACRYGVIDHPALRLFAADCAERALLRERGAGREPDPRSFAAVVAVRAHARGEITDEDLSAADSAARSAWFAANSPSPPPGLRAARFAARSAWFAAKATTLAWFAAVGAATVATKSTAAWSAEIEWQTARLRLYLTGEPIPPVETP